MDSLSHLKNRKDRNWKYSLMHARAASLQGKETSDMLLHALSSTLRKKKRKGQSSPTETSLNISNT